MSSVLFLRCPFGTHVLLRIWMLPKKNTTTNLVEASGERTLYQVMDLIFLSGSMQASHLINTRYHSHCTTNFTDNNSLYHLTCLYSLSFLPLFISNTTPRGYGIF